MITVTDIFTNTDGSPSSGFVAFLLTTPLTHSTTGVRIAAAPVVAVLDEDGAISVLLAATNDPAWITSAYYTVTEYLDGQLPSTYTIVVPYDAAAGTISLGLCPRGT